MKRFTDRVLRNPLTTLIGVAFAVVGVWILKWSDDLSEASRVLLSVLCFAIAMTGLGWRDKSFMKVLDLFKNKTNLLVMIDLGILLSGVTGCSFGVSKRKIYNAVIELKATIESNNNANKIILYENAKKTVDNDFESINDADLLNEINELTRSVLPTVKPKGKP